MATGFEAIDTIARKTGISLATGFRAARILKEEDGQDLWPKAGRGGGSLKGRDVEPRHLTNLLIALAVAQPFTSGPKIVRVYRDLVRVGPEQDQILPGSTLGEALDKLITDLAEDDQAVRCCYGRLRIEFILGREPSALVSSIDDFVAEVNGTSNEPAHWVDRYELAERAIPGLMDSTQKNHAAAAIHRIAIVPRELIYVLANIAQDSLRRPRQHMPRFQVQRLRAQKSKDESRLRMDSRGLRRSAPRTWADQLSTLRKDIIQND